MGSEVSYVKIGDHSIVYSGFSFKSKDLGGGGIPVVKIKNVKNRTVNLSDTQFFPEHLITDKHDKFYLKNGDVLIAMTGQGSVGRVGRLNIKDNYQVLLNQRVGKFEVNPSLDLRYLYYILSSKYYKDILFNAASGSGQPNLSPSIISNIEIPFVNINQQKAIAHILGSLDDKIELNRQINKTLESMAQALFKSWFVDFDPVIDNAIAAGNPIPEPLQARAAKRVAWISDSAIREQNQTISKQFPSEFEFNEEMGWIPKGWVVMSIEDVTSNIIDHRGKTPKKLGGEWSKSGYPAISAKNVKARRIVRPDTIRFVDEDMYRKWMKIPLEKGDIAMTSEAPLGELYYFHSKPNYLLSQRLYGIRANKMVCSGSYLFHWLQTNTASSDLLNRATGTTVTGIRQSELRQVKILCASRNVIDSFSTTAEEHLAKIDSNEQSNINLEKLRDTLLPKLLSGEIRIPDAEKLIAEAT